MTRFATIAVLLITSPIAFAADTQQLNDRAGVCSVSIPSNWKVTPLGTAQSADKKDAVILTSPRHGLTSLAQVHEIAPKVYKDDKVVKDSSSEFEMQGKAQNGKPNFYRAIPAGADKVCIVEVIYEDGSLDNARKIAESVKPVK
jgi:hypothetical protein